MAIHNKSHRNHALTSINKMDKDNKFKSNFDKNEKSMRWVPLGRRND